MKLGELLHEVLCEKYLGQTIKSEFDGYFVVDDIIVEHGVWGDPPVEITFRSKECVEESKRMAEWRQQNSPDGNIPTPKEIDDAFRNAWLHGSVSLSDFNDELPEL